MTALGAFSPAPGHGRRDGVVPTPQLGHGIAGRGLRPYRPRDADLDAHRRIDDAEVFRQPRPWGREGPDLSQLRGIDLDPPAGQVARRHVSVAGVDPGAAARPRD